MTRWMVEAAERGMQGSQGEMPGLRNAQGRLHGLQVAQLSDEHHVRVLAQGGPQGRRKGPGIGVNLPLVDQAVPVVVQELDGIFNGQDMGLPIAVDPVDHGGQGGGLAAAGGARHQDESPGLPAECPEYRRQIEGVKALDPEGNGPKNGTHGPPLVEAVATKPGQPSDSKGEVKFQVVLQMLLLIGGQYAVNQPPGILGRQERNFSQGPELSVHPNPGMSSGGEVEIGCSHFSHCLEQFGQARRLHGKPRVGP